MVWSEPILSLSKKYNTSALNFRKICTEMNVPVPKSGHWTKVNWGKHVTKEPLDVAYTGPQAISLSVNQDGVNNIVPLSPIKKRRQELLNDTKTTLKVPAKLTNPNKLIIAAQNSLSSRKHTSFRNDLLSTDYGEVDIKVTPGLMGRSLRIMDTLIKALRSRGHQILFKNGQMYAVIEGSELEISLRETTKRFPRPDQRNGSDYKPTGLLCFKMRIISRQKEWMDGKRLIEEQLLSIFAQLEIEGRKDKIYREQIDKHWEDYYEKERIKKELIKRKDEELEKFKVMFVQANRLHQVNVLRDYINTVEANAISKNIMTGELGRWIEWARKKADWFDPFIEADDDLLRDFNKDNIFEIKQKNHY